MRFGETPNNQLNINFEAHEIPKTKEDEVDEIVKAISADCEAAKQRRVDSKPVVTSIKEIEAMIKAGRSIRKAEIVDAEAERKIKEYWKKVYSGVRPEQKPEGSGVGEKTKKTNNNFVDYKKMQYKDDVAEDLN